MLINPHMLRLFWTIVEETQSQELLTLSDTALVAALMQQVSRQILLSGEEVCRLYDYIGTRLVLIRDTADSRQFRSFDAASPIPVAHTPAA